MLFFRNNLYLVLVWDFFLLIVWYLLLIAFIIPNYYKVLRSRRLRANKIKKRFNFIKENKKSYDLKKKQRRYYKCSDVRLGGDKFFNIINITTRVLSKAFTNSQLKQIPVVDKKEVMQSLNHPHAEIEGVFKLENNEQEHTAFMGITHSRSHDLVDKNNKPFKVDSFFIEKENDDYFYMGPELRFLNKDEINKTKLYKNESNFIEKKEKMNLILNNQFSNNGKIGFIEGFKDNKMKEGKITKIENNGEKIYKISEIKDTDIINNLDKINKLI